MKTKVFFVIASLLAALSASADSSDKFFKKAADEVWSMNIPEFDASTPIPDEVSSNHSAVIIASYTDIDARLTHDNNFSKARAVGLLETNTTHYRTIKRDTEDYLCIPEKDRIKKDAKVFFEDEDDTNSFFERFANDIMGEENKITEKKIISWGNTPANPDFKFSLKGSGTGFITDAGAGDLLVKVGTLVGENKGLTGSDRDREIDICVATPLQESYSITLKVPDGYKADQASVEVLASNTNNQTGIFFVQPTINYNGDVEIRVAHRITQYIIPVASWPDFLTLVDAGSAFNNATILLTRK